MNDRISISVSFIIKAKDTTNAIMKTLNALSELSAEQISEISAYNLPDDDEEITINWRN